MPAVRIPAPSGGLNTEAAPEAVDNDQSPELVNFLPRDGKAVLRGPLVSQATMPNFDDLPIVGSLDHGALSLVGATDATDRSRPSDLYKFDSSIKQWAVFTVPDSTWMPTTQSVVHGTDPGGYAFAFGGRTASAPAASPVRPLLAWNGVSHRRFVSSGGELWAPAAYGDGPCDLAVHLERLWTLGADFDSASDLHGYGIRWTDAGGLTASLFEASSRQQWKDDVSGLYNAIQLPINGDRPRAFGKAADQLLIFTGHKTWMLSGRSPSNFVLREVIAGIGCLRAETVVNWDDGCYFLSAEGFMRYDGSTLTNVSGTVRAEIVNAVHRTGQLAPMPSPSAIGQARAIPGGYILLTIGLGNSMHFAGLYDIRRRTWSRFSTALARFAPTWTFKNLSDGHVYGFDQLNAYDMSYVGVPEARIGQDYGHDFTDLEITATWRSKSQKLASPLQSAYITRVAIDSAFQAADPTALGPTISVMDGRGESLLAETAVDTTAADDVQRKRFQESVEKEAEDAAVEVRYSGAATLTRAEVYDAALEYTSGRNRPSV